MSKNILIVDDEPVQRRLLEAALRKKNHMVTCAESGEQALSLIKESPAFDAIILDLLMPGISGMEVLDKLHEQKDTTPVIVQTATGGIDVVVNAMRAGAFDFIVKPVSPDKLNTTIERAIRFKGAAKSVTTKPNINSSKISFKDFVTRSPAMETVLKVAKKAAISNIPVLIEGESGVGKEVIARAMHAASPRADKKLVTVNCGALPENLVESILFGHEKGAFTGATDKHVGKFEEANGGTLFLDEIGELPLDLQVKLLRAIQEGEIDPIGAKRSFKVDVRIISATNRNLRDEIGKGKFREDLFYRLSVLPITIPPLNKRRDDIEPLIFHFIKKIGREQGRNDISAIQPDALKALLAYDWPGNIRELENAVFRAIILNEGEELRLADFPQIEAQMPGFELPGIQWQKTVEDHPTFSSDQTPNLQTPSEQELQIGSVPETALNQFEAKQKASHSGLQTNATSNYGMVSLIGNESNIRPLEEIEAETIRFAVEVYNGQMSEVARRLGIGRSTLYRKLRDMGIAQNEE